MLDQSRELTSSGRERTPIRVAVVDDHPLMRGGIVQALGREKDLEVVGEGRSADEAVAIAKEVAPDVMLVDVNMPGGGLEALERIRTANPRVSCIIITVREDVETVGQSLRVGARGYVLKGISGEDLAQTVRLIHQGEAYITPALAARLLSMEQASRSGQEMDETSSRLRVLTDRELQILRLIAKGYINKQIGAKMDLSEKTIKHYVTNILQKLQVSNRVEAAIIAQRDLKIRG